MGYTAQKAGLLNNFKKNYLIIKFRNFCSIVSQFLA